MNVNQNFAVVGLMAEIKLSSIGWLKIYEQQWNLFVCDDWKIEQPKILIVEIDSTKKTFHCQKSVNIQFYEWH